MTEGSAADIEVLAELLARGLGELGGQLAAVEPAPAATLAQLTLWVDRIGRQTNLTGHRGPEEIARRLVLDAVALLDAVARASDLDLAGVDEVVDLGSGAGFPGFPVAILLPHARVKLVDSRERRHLFQRRVRRELGLGNVEPILGRIEDLEPSPSSLVFAQAVARPSQVLSWGMDWVRAGGVLVIPGAQHPPDPGPHDALRGTGHGEYEVPLGGPHRTFWWGRVAELGPNAPTPP